LHEGEGERKRERERENEVQTTGVEEERDEMSKGEKMQLENETWS
jgi:hypothetical protein